MGAKDILTPGWDRLTPGGDRLTGCTRGWRPRAGPWADRSQECDRTDSRPAPDPVGPGVASGSHGLRRTPVQPANGHNAPAEYPAPSYPGDTATAGGAPLRPACRGVQSLSGLPLHHHFLDLRYGPRRIQVLRANVRAVHDRMTPVQPEGVFQLIQPLTGRLIPAVDDPAIRSQQRGRSQESIAVPPVAGARGRAARTQDTGRRTINLFLILLGLQSLLVRRWRRPRLQPRLNGGVLGVEI